MCINGEVRGLGEGRWVDGMRGWRGQGEKRSCSADRHLCVPLSAPSAVAVLQLELSPDNKSACITFFTYKNSLKVGDRGRRTVAGEKKGDGGLDSD
jgi:hypothetical protein